MVLGLVELEQSPWGHLDYRFVVNGRLGSYEDTDVYNGCKCYKWRIDGYSTTEGSFKV